MTPTSTVVNHNPAQATPPAAAPTVAAPPAGADAAALQARISALEGEVGEHKRTAEFWHGKATKGVTPPAAPAPKEEPEEDILDILSTRGAKGLDELMAKRGFVRKEEAETLVNNKAAQVTKEAQLMRDYPDLAKKDSEMFKVTAEHYGQLTSAGLSEAMAMELAVERAELQLLRAGKLQTPKEKEAAEKATREQRRLERIAAQAGDSGNRAPLEGEEDDELNPQQLHIVRSMLVGQPGKDGKPMDEAAAIETYKARAKRGVSMKGNGR